MENIILLSDNMKAGIKKWLHAQSQVIDKIKDEGEKNSLQKNMQIANRILIGDLDMQNLKAIFNGIETTAHQNMDDIFKQVQEQEKIVNNYIKNELAKFFVELRKEAEDQDIDIAPVALYDLIIVARNLLKHDPKNKEAKKFLDKANLTNLFHAQIAKSQELGIGYEYTNIIVAAKQISELYPDHSLAQELISEKKLKGIFDKLWSNGQIEDCFIVLKIAEQLQKRSLAEEWMPYKEVVEECNYALENNTGYAQALAEFIDLAYQNKQQAQELIKSALHQDVSNILHADKPNLSLAADLYYDLLIRSKQQNGFNDEKALNGYLSCKIAQYLVEQHPIQGVFLNWENDSIQNAKAIADHIITQSKPILPREEKDLLPFVNQVALSLSAQTINLYKPEILLAGIPSLIVGIQNWKRSAGTESSEVINKLMEVHPRLPFGNHGKTFETQFEGAIEAYLVTCISSYLQQQYPFKEGFIAKAGGGGLRLVTL